MTRPLVSIVVPLFNHARYIEASLRSVLQQTYRPIELIVIDDGSTDESASLAAALLKREMSQAIFVQRENRGAHHTINEGLSVASGRYLTILNSDDIYHPERIERCVETAERARREFVFTEVEFIDESGNQVTRDDYADSIEIASQRSSRYPSIGFALMKNQIAVSTGNFFFSRTLLEKIGGFRHYRYVHDWDFILRALFHTEPYFIRERLYKYRLHRRNSFKTL